MQPTKLLAVAAIPWWLYAQLLHQLRVCQWQQHHLLQLPLHISQAPKVGKPTRGWLPVLHACLLLQQHSPLLLLLLLAPGWLQQRGCQLLCCFL